MRIQNDYITRLEKRISELEKDNRFLTEYINQLRYPKEIIFNDRSFAAGKFGMIPCVIIEVVPKNTGFESLYIAGGNNVIISRETMETSVGDSY